MKKIVCRCCSVIPFLPEYSGHYNLKEPSPIPPRHINNWLPLAPKTKLFNAAHSPAYCSIMDISAPRSASRPRPPSRPTTPLRPSSRSSIRDSHGYGSSLHGAGYTEPAINALEPQFAELADSMADLEANLMHLQLMHESLARFSESFASFLYGLNMNAFCVDFPEVYTQGIIVIAFVLGD